MTDENDTEDPFEKIRRYIEEQSKMPHVATNIAARPITWPGHNRKKAPPPAPAAPPPAPPAEVPPPGAEASVAPDAGAAAGSKGDAPAPGAVSPQGADAEDGDKAPSGE